MAARDDTARRRARVAAICAALPETEERAGQHSKFTVRGKTFAYFLHDHHGDGVTAINCKAPPGMQRSLLESGPGRFFTPSYLGARGWIGLRIDTPHVDWSEVEALIRESYRLVAPKRLALLA